MGEKDKKEETARRSVRFAVGEEEKKEKTPRRVFVLGGEVKKEEITEESDFISVASSSSSQPIKTPQTSTATSRSTSTSTSTSRTTLSDIFDGPNLKPPANYNTDDLYKPCDVHNTGDPFSPSDDYDTEDEIDSLISGDFNTDDELDEFDPDDYTDTESDEGSTSKYYNAKVVNITCDDDPDIVEEIQSEAVQREEAGLPPLYENHTFFSASTTAHAKFFR